MAFSDESNSDDPLRNSSTADEWESFLAEKRAQVDHHTRELADAEGELNERVFALFQLTKDEIAPLEREVEH